MDTLDSMVALSTEIADSLEDPTSDRARLAARLSDLMSQARDAVGVQGHVDVTYDGNRGHYVGTLKRPHHALGSVCASQIILARYTERRPRPSLGVEVLRALNRLDDILTREERLHAGRGFPRRGLG